MIKKEAIVRDIVRIYSTENFMIQSPSGQVHLEYIIKEPNNLNEYHELIEN